MSVNHYYNADELLSRHYNINMICGDRFGGKSTCIQRYTIKRALKGEQFAVLTRYDKDIATLCTTYFNNTMEQWYSDYELIFKNRKFYLKKKNSEKVKLVGYGFALNQATKMKSTSYPKINTIILEEFLNMEDKYIKSQANPELEVEMLLSLYSTIARGAGKQYRDNVRVFCVSNAYYINNPYFRYFDTINAIIKNPLKRFYEKKTEPKCLIEMTHNNVNTGIGRDETHRGSKFRDMLSEVRIAKPEKKQKVLMQLTFDNTKFLSVITFNDTNLIYETSTMSQNCPIYSCSEIKKKDIYNIAVLKKMEAFKILKSLFDRNLLYFDKFESFILFYNIINF